MDPTLDQLTDDIRRRVAELGFELVDLSKGGTKARTRLQVRVDRPDAVPGHGISVDECAAVSRALEAWLDAGEILGPRYVLEVSSPGIERPVRWREHWERYRGRDVQVRIQGRGRFRATIERVVGDTVALRPAHEAETIEVPLTAIRDATLVVDWSAVGRDRTDHTK
jgi:ribosome maturation factor RimP